MNDTSYSPTLLPTGLYDLIGEQADAEAGLVNRFTAHFSACGYLRVQPPLMEFAASLLGGQEDSVLARQSLRVMDPISQQMMALRADMTMQVARIAGGQLKDTPRPLRLCYGGQTLRSMPDAMRASRQFRQIGIELFGSDSNLADVEIMQVAISALQSLDIQELTLDISTPHMLPLLLDSVDSSHYDDALHAISHKDVGRLEQLGYNQLAALCAVTDTADAALTRLADIELPEAARQIIRETSEAMTHLNARLGDSISVNITFDPLEMHGFGYYSGISFALYTPGRPQELGRGGRYTTPQGEAATGFTLYAEDILPLLPASSKAARILLPGHCDEATAASWRAKGYQTGYALSEDAKPSGYDYILNNELTDIVKVEHS